MKILVVSGFWPRTTNPITGIFVVQRVAALARAGVQVTVLVADALKPGAGRLCSLQEVGLDDTRVAFTRVPFVRLPEQLSKLPGALHVNSLSCGGALSMAVRRAPAPFDGCIIHGLRYAGLSYPMWRHRLHGRTALVLDGLDSFYDRPDNLRRMRTLLAKAIGLVDVVVPVGTPLEDHARKLGARENRIRTLANGTDLPRRKEISARQRPVEECRRIVSVSNLIPLKGISDNLEALAHIARTTPGLAWQYRVIGDGPSRAALEALAGNLGISERVKFLGRLPYAETMREISEADIFSLPSPSYSRDLPLR